MAFKKLYAGDSGPYIYDDTALIADRDGDFIGVLRHACVTDGQVWIGEAPTEDEHVVRLVDMTSAIAVVGGATPGNTVVTEFSYNQLSSAGSAAEFSRKDHTHGTPASQLVGCAQITVGTAAPGSPSVGDLWIDTN